MGGPHSEWLADGAAAWDVAYNFIQRWNSHRRSNGEIAYPYLLPPRAEYASRFPSATLPFPPCVYLAIPLALHNYLHDCGFRPVGKGTCSCQVLRSICRWSGGNRTETSILNACITLCFSLSLVRSRARARTHTHAISSDPSRCVCVCV